MPCSRQPSREVKGTLMMGQSRLPWVNKSNDSSSCTRLGSLLYSVDTISPMLFGRPCKATPFHRAEDQVVQIPYGLQSINNVCLKQFIKVSILSTLYFSSSCREPLKVSGPGLGHALVSHSIHLISSKLFREMWLRYLGGKYQGGLFPLERETGRSKQVASRENRRTFAAEFFQICLSEICPMLWIWSHLG